MTRDANLVRLPALHRALIAAEHHRCFRHLERELVHPDVVATTITSSCLAHGAQRGRGVRLHLIKVHVLQARQLTAFRYKGPQAVDALF